MGPVELPHTLKWDELYKWFVVNVTGSEEPIQAVSGTTDYPLTTGMLTHVVSTERPVAAAGVPRLPDALPVASGAGRTYYKLTPEFDAAVRLSFCIIAAATRRGLIGMPSGDSDYLRLMACVTEAVSDWMKGCTKALHAAADSQERLEAAKKEVAALSGRRP